MTRHRPNPFYETWRPNSQDRARLERAIELLIDLLNAVDGDPDSEPYLNGSMRLYQPPDPEEPGRPPVSAEDPGVAQPWRGDGKPEISRRRHVASGWKR